MKKADKDLLVKLIDTLVNALYAIDDAQKVLNQIIENGKPEASTFRDLCRQINEVENAMPYCSYGNTGSREDTDFAQCAEFFECVGHGIGDGLSISISYKRELDDDKAVEPPVAK